MEKYAGLKGLSGFARLVGWIGLIGSFAAGFYGAVQFANPQNMMGPLPGLFMLIGAVITFTVCSVLVIVGEAVQVFIDTEANTNRSARLLEAMTNGDGSPQRSRVMTPVNAPVT